MRGRRATGSRPRRSRRRSPPSAASGLRSRGRDRSPAMPRRRCTGQVTRPTSQTPTGPAPRPRDSMSAVSGGSRRPSPGDCALSKGLPYAALETGVGGYPQGFSCAAWLRMPIRACPGTRSPRGLSRSGGSADGASLDSRVRIASISPRSRASAKRSALCRSRRSPRTPRLGCRLSSGSRSSTARRARSSAALTDATVVASASAASLAVNPSTSRRTNADRWRAGRSRSASGPGARVDRVRLDPRGDRERSWVCDAGSRGRPEIKRHDPIATAGDHVEADVGRDPVQPRARRASSPELR
jgi:hypothetical protein